MSSTTGAENSGQDIGEKRPAEAQIRRHEGDASARHESLSRAVHFLLCLIRNETQRHCYHLSVTRAQCADKRLEEALDKENERELMLGLASHNVFVHEFRAAKKGSNDPKEVLLEVQWGDGSEDEEDEDDLGFEVVPLSPEPRPVVGKEEVSDKGKGKARLSVSSEPTGTRPRASLSSIRPRLSHAPPPGISLRTGSLKDILSNLTVQTIAAENWSRSKLVLVNSNQIVEKALSRFNVHSISSVPVADSANRGVIGLIDVCTTVKFLASSYKEDAKSSAIKADFFNKKISEVLQEIKPEAFIISMASNLFHAARQLVEHNVERLIMVDRPIQAKTSVPLVEPEHSVIGLLTQSDLIRFLSQNVGWMKKEPIFARSIGSIGLGQRQPRTVNYNSKTITAFAEISRNPAEGAAVVDDEGQLVGNLSASDIRGMNKRVFSMIFKPLREYLQRDKRRGWWTLPIVIRLSDTLEHVIFQFVATKVHRMYVTDEGNSPVGEVNLGDVLRVIVEHLGGPFQTEAVKSTVTAPSTPLARVSLVSGVEAQLKEGSTSSVEVKAQGEATEETESKSEPVSQPKIAEDKELETKETEAPKEGQKKGEGKNIKEELKEIGEIKKSEKREVKVEEEAPRWVGPVEEETDKMTPKAHP